MHGAHRNNNNNNNNTNNKSIGGGKKNNKKDASPDALMKDAHSNEELKSSQLPPSSVPQQSPVRGATNLHQQNLQQALVPKDLKLIQKTAAANFEKTLREYSYFVDNAGNDGDRSSQRSASGTSTSLSRMMMGQSRSDSSTRVNEEPQPLEMANATYLELMVRQVAQVTQYLFGFAGQIFEVDTQYKTTFDSSSIEYKNFAEDGDCSQQWLEKTLFKGEQYYTYQVIDMLKLLSYASKGNCPFSEEGNLTFIDQPTQVALEASRNVASKKGNKLAIAMTGGKYRKVEYDPKKKIDKDKLFYLQNQQVFFEVMTQGNMVPLLTQYNKAMLELQASPEVLSIEGAKAFNNRMKQFYSYFRANCGVPITDNNFNVQFYSFQAPTNSFVVVVITCAGIILDVAFYGYERSLRVLKERGSELHSEKWLEYSNLRLFKLHTLLQPACCLKGQMREHFRECWKLSVPDELSKRSPQEQEEMLDEDCEIIEAFASIYLLYGSTASLQLFPDTLSTKQSELIFHRGSSMLKGEAKEQRDEQVRSYIESLPVAFCTINWFTLSGSGEKVYDSTPNKFMNHDKYLIEKEKCDGTDADEDMGEEEEEEEGKSQLGNKKWSQQPQKRDAVHMQVAGKRLDRDVSMGELLKMSDDDEIHSQKPQQQKTLQQQGVTPQQQKRTRHY